MERKLYKAAAEGDAASLVDLLKDDPLILDRCMVWYYNETPLHIAAMLGHEKFVDEILDRNPKLAGELDSQKFSPLHLAAAKGHLGVVKKLLTVNADMCYARDRYGRNPLHIAAVKGRIDVLKELIRESPDAAHQKMGHGETILHLCVKHNNLEALKLLVESFGDPEFVNLKNDNGDTILHQAAADKQTETMSFLTSFTTVEANSPNADGLTAYDLLAQSGKPGRNMDNINNFCEAGATTATAILRAPSRSEIESMMMGASPPNANDQNIASPMQRKSLEKNLNKQYDWLERKKGALMVVASLTATMAFQVGVNPPGGFWQETTRGDNSKYSHTAGFSIMADNYPGRYLLFSVVNTISFLASLSIILLLVSGLPLRRRFFMWILMVIMWIAITSIALTYGLSMTLFTPSHEKNSIYKITGVGILLWFGLMVLLLVGHTIRLIWKTIRKLRKSVRRSSASVVMRQDSVR
ncbi:ankyrin repeat-containing protein ITN1-like [Syzygium oleosum]|uniref:ankyrin repeat-containing protein ITN1-like n=1 Tax=Syzygium oleosum TaxID=219896 RepID=UPI0024B9E113|nr:ankyrin repeat-containing protein ITN1-like [Syzygium oleosum]